MAVERKDRRVLSGTVASTKAKNTITVEVERTYKHARYGKFVRARKRYMAHDSEEAAAMGDLVEITATRPLSKRKRWRVEEIVQKATPGRGVAGRAAA